MPLFLGLDLSTQGLKCTIVNEDCVVVDEEAVKFDKDCPEFKTESGTHSIPETGQVICPVQMWVKAIDLLFSRMHDRKLPLDEIVAISGAAQQHSSIWFGPRAKEVLANLDPKKSLQEQLGDIFALDYAPSWQDASTQKQCDALEKLVGGPEEMAKRTGSRCHHRFTGPQIMSIKELHPKEYETAERICLTSAGLATMLAANGKFAPMDESDACGMNLLNMAERRKSDHPVWDKLVMRGVVRQTTDVLEGKPEDDSKKIDQQVEELERKLGRVEGDTSAITGKLGKYYCDRYGFKRDCALCTFTGDNPATLLSFALKPKDAMISLGSSDTVLINANTYAPNPEFHLLTHPAATPDRDDNDSESSRYMGMLVYKNGSLTREFVKGEYAQKDKSWNEFNSMVESTAIAGSKSGKEDDRHFGFYYHVAEIIPQGIKGIYKYEGNGKKEVNDFSDKTLNPRLILEQQFMSYRIRAARMLASESEGAQDEISGDNAEIGFDPTSHNVLPRRIIAVGGAAANETILKTACDIFGVPVYKPAPPPTEDIRGKPTEGEDPDYSAHQHDDSGMGRHVKDSHNVPGPGVRVQGANIHTKSGGGGKKKADANSCSVGGALKARWCYLRREPKNKGMSFEKSVALAREKQAREMDTEGADEEGLLQAVNVGEDSEKVFQQYGSMIPTYLKLEGDIVKNFKHDK